MHVLGQQYPCFNNEQVLPPHLPNDPPQNPSTFGLDQQRLPAIRDDREKNNCHPAFALVDNLPWIGILRDAVGGAHPT